MTIQYIPQEELEDEFRGIKLDDIQYYVSYDEVAEFDTSEAEFKTAYRKVKSFCVDGILAVRIKDPTRLKKLTEKYTALESDRFTRGRLEFGILDYSL